MKNKFKKTVALAAVCAAVLGSAVNFPVDRSFNANAVSDVKGSNIGIITPDPILPGDYSNTICFLENGNDDCTVGEYDNMIYLKYSDHIDIVDCTEDAVNLNIPVNIENLPVTKIGRNAFIGNC